MADSISKLERSMTSISKATADSRLHAFWSIKLEAITKQKGEVLFSEELESVRIIESKSKEVLVGTFRKFNKNNSGVDKVVQNILKAS